MRSALLISGLVALAAAQSIDFNQITAAPEVVYTQAPATGTAQSVSAQPSAAAQTVGSAAVLATPEAKRAVAVQKRDGDCSVQPAGTGPDVHYPDTPEAFQKNSYFANLAYSAPIPVGYTPAFINKNASTSTASYMGYTTLNQYDTLQCASLCNKQTGCVAFNLYFERDPSLNPNSKTCPNPPSLDNIKCVFWGVPISDQTATNDGQVQASFHVVIAGSNGYNLVTPPSSFPGFSGPVAWPGAPAVPVDPTKGYSTYLGSQYFSFGSGPGQIQYYSTGACVAACSAQTTYNIANSLPGSHPSLCNQVVTYVVKDPYSQPQGVYCAFFTESWDASYGTVQSSFTLAGQFTYTDAYAYTNATYSATYPVICTGSSCQKQYLGGNCGGYGGKYC